jgi:hypothetical protein
MTRLPDLQRELVAAAARLDEEAATAIARPRPRRPGPRRVSATRVVILALLAALALAAIGAAATGLLRSGPDVQPRSGKAPTPKTGFGVPTGPIAPPIVVDDPDGGALKWGLRAFTTTRGYACLQLGRVQDGKLGLIGRDGAFEDDGLFHALGPQVLDRGACVPLDARGHGFLALRDAEMPAAGMHDCLPPSMVKAFGGRVPPKMKACGRDGMRTVDYGLLGPEARSITYTLLHGGTRTVPVAPPAGAFLIVSPPQRSVTLSGASGHGGRMTGPDDYLISQTPESRTLVSVTYADGSTCRVRHTISPYGGCPVKGFVPAAARAPSRRAVASRVTARIARNAQGSFTLHVAFRAGVAADVRHGAYWVTIRPPSGCSFGVQGHSIDRDVSAGTRVGAAIKIDRRSCRGFYDIEVEFRIPRRFSRFGQGLRYPGTPVGAASAELVK